MKLETKIWNLVCVGVWAMSAPLDAAISVLGGCDDEIVAATVGAMLGGYDDAWGNSGWYAVPGSIEQEFCLPVVNPASKNRSQSKTFVYAGRLDMLAAHPDHPGQLFLLDHKTTSEDIEDGDSSYWRRLRIDPQASTYMLASWQSGVKLDGALWDVLRKPTIRPKKLTKDGIAEISGRQTYCGASVAHETFMGVMRGEIVTENGELFGHRFYAEICESPTKYFARRPVPRSDQDLLDIAAEIWGIAEAARDCHASGRWLKTGSPHGCMTYGRPCEYLGICSGFDSTDSQHWKAGESPRKELSLAQKPAGLKVLTNTSMGTFKLCQRKYQYRYVMGIQREERSEALFFGSILHQCLEAYWASLPVPPEAAAEHSAAAPAVVPLHEEFLV